MPWYDKETLDADHSWGLKGNCTISSKGTRFPFKITGDKIKEGNIVGIYQKGMGTSEKNLSKAIYLYLNLIVVAD